MVSESDETAFLKTAQTEHRANKCCAEQGAHGDKEGKQLRVDDWTRLVSGKVMEKPRDWRGRRGDETSAGNKQQTQV